LIPTRVAILWNAGSVLKDVHPEFLGRILAAEERLAGLLIVGLLM
jgi:hypothetical protein